MHKYNDVQVAINEYYYMWSHSACGRVHKNYIYIYIYIIRWLNDSRDSVCVLIANLHDLYYREELLENNWALAPMDQWKRYISVSNRLLQN